MPAGDRTGPWGAGPRTGRGFGFCSGYDAPGYAYPAPGMGRGRGFGGGFGFGPGSGRGPGAGRGRRFHRPWAWGFRDYPVPPGAPVFAPGEEKAALAEEAAFLESELGRIKERLGELEKGRTAKKNMSQKPSEE
jgi:hypothetical protein